MMRSMTATVLHLPTARSISHLDVATLADSRTYARGVEYLRRGRVDVVELLDHSVTATVAGSTPYLVRLAVGRRGVEHHCSCPLGVEGTFCKHLVAVALAVAGLTADDAPIDDADPTDVRAALATLDKDELVGLLASAASEDPALGALLERRLAHDGPVAGRSTWPATAGRSTTASCGRSGPTG